jgi:hypothetical protein
MAYVAFAHLCTAASFRDGLLSVLEAGLQQFEPDELPYRMQPTLAFQLILDESDLGRAHPMSVDVTHQDGERIAGLTFDFSMNRPPGTDPELPIAFTAIQLLPMDLRRDGLYSVRVAIDGLEPTQLPFRVRAKA